MTTQIARMFATPQAATAAAGSLQAEGFPAASITVVRAAGDDVSAITARIMSALVLRAHAKVYADSVANGASLVIVRAPWGTAVRAQKVMDQFQPIASGVEERRDSPPVWDDKRPLSSALGLKLLVGSAAPVSKMLNLPLLSGTAAPLSDVLRISLLAKASASLSKAVGLPMATRSDRSLSKAIGLPAISRTGRLLSEIIRLPTSAKCVGIPSVLRGAPGISETLGLPTVSKRGRPTSAALGIPILTKGHPIIPDGVHLRMAVQRRSRSSNPGPN